MQVADLIPWLISREALMVREGILVIDPMIAPFLQKGSTVHFTPMSSLMYISPPPKRTARSYLCACAKKFCEVFSATRKFLSALCAREKTGNYRPMRSAHFVKIKQKIRFLFRRKATGELVAEILCEIVCPRNLISAAASEANAGDEDIDISCIDKPNIYLPLVVTHVFAKVGDSAVKEPITELHLDPDLISLEIGICVDNAQPQTEHGDCRSNKVGDVHRGPQK